MFSGAGAIQPTPPSLSSGEMRSFDQEQPHVGDSVDPQAGTETQIPAIYQPTGTDDIAPQPPSINDFAPGQGYSHGQMDTATVYGDGVLPPSRGSLGHGIGNSETGGGVFNPLDLPPSRGSLGHGNGNSQTGGDILNPHDLPPSRTDVDPRETSQTGSSTANQNLASEAHGKMSLTGKNLQKNLPPEYLMDEEEEDEDEY